MANNSLGIAGISPQVRLLPVPFLGDQGGTLLDAIAAMDYVTDLRQRGVNVRVINASWGGSTYSALLEDSLRAAGDAGVMVVASAGNSGSDQPTYPAAYNLPNVIAVGAQDSAGQPAIFSNTGSWVDLSAPGVDILSTTADGGYGWMSGTSQAAPFVSGLVALMAAAFPAATVGDMRDAILNGVQPSAGRLDVQASLSWLAQLTTEPDPVAAPVEVSDPIPVADPIAVLDPIGILDPVLVDPIDIGIGIGVDVGAGGIRIDWPSWPAEPVIPVNGLANFPVDLPINPVTVELGVSVPVMGSTPPNRLLGVDLVSVELLIDRPNAAGVAVIVDRPDRGRRSG